MKEARVLMSSPSACLLPTTQSITSYLTLIYLLYNLSSTTTMPSLLPPPSPPPPLLLLLSFLTSSHQPLSPSLFSLTASFTLTLPHPSPYLTPKESCPLVKAQKGFIYFFTFTSCPRVCCLGNASFSSHN